MHFIYRIIVNGGLQIHLMPRMNGISCRLLQLFPSGHRRFGKGMTRIGGRMPESTENGERWAMDKKNRIDGRRAGPMRLRRVGLLLAVVLIGFAAGCASLRELSGQSATGAGSAGSAAGSANAVFATATSAPPRGERLKASSADAAGAAASDAAGFAAPDPAGSSVFAAEWAGERKIIYSAEVVMEVEDFDRAQTELDNLIALSGGYLLHFNDSRNVREIGGQFTIKVPSDGFKSFLGELEKLKKGNDFRRNVRGEDVTEEYVDLAARLRAKEAVEARLLELMKQATEAKDLLSFSNELARVQEEIEKLKGKIRYINENVAYSTVSLRMYQVIEDDFQRPGDDPLLSRIGEAFVDGVQGVIRFLGDVLVFLAGALPVLALVAIAAAPAAWGIRRSLQKRRAKRQAGDNPPAA